MCFSAPASFVASGGLGLVAAATFTAAPPKKRILALVPLLFAAQQALEGIQWLALGAGTTCRAAGYGYLVIGLMIWPILVPAMVYWFDPASRKRVRWFVFLGVVVALGYAYALTRGLGVGMAHEHIAYRFFAPFGPPSVILYGVTILGSLWASSIATFRQYGVIVCAAGVAAIAVERLAFASLWCFFAALASVLVYVYVRHR